MTIGILALAIGLVLGSISLIGYATTTNDNRAQTKVNNYSAVMPKEI